MSEQATIPKVLIEDEMRQSYMDYAMSVIVGRALPDVRDGLKPVHRRILYAMHEANLHWNRQHRKSAKVVGEVLGNYHPHGESSVYDTIVRMAQDFSLRYPLVDGQGNFGSVDGDSPASMRYTEVRMSRIAAELLTDLDRDTVDFAPNYDDTSREPEVLPAAFPHLLVNGSSGIAVGMATNIPAHNLGEIIDAVLLLLEDPQVADERLFATIPGPDFPTAAIINGSDGILEAYRSGRGHIRVRARCNIEREEGKPVRIVVTELPYQVNKARLQEAIADLVKNKKLTGLRGLRDESDREGIRLVIELRRGEVPEVVLNNLYKQTRLELTFGINMVALVDGRPQLLSLRRMLEIFLRHRREVVVRRTRHELRRARARAHVLEGLAAALANLDKVVEMIKAAKDPAMAREALLRTEWPVGPMLQMLQRADPTLTRPTDLEPELGLQGEVYHLSVVQAQSILDMRLQRLTGLEQDKIIQEYSQLLDSIRDLLDILGCPQRLLEIIRGELLDIRERFADPRRTEIIRHARLLRVEDLITDEEVVVTLSHVGYIKAQPISDYRAQRRGGRGRTASGVRSEDFIEQLFIAATHDTLLCFSSMGRVFWVKVYELPLAGHGARGRPVVNLLQLEEAERISAVLPVREFSEDRYVFMATADGTVKKVRLSAFARPMRRGIIALRLSSGNRLVRAGLTDGDDDVMLFSSDGKVIRFREGEVRATGRTSRGVRGIRMTEGEQLISMIIPEPDIQVLTVTRNGYGKRTPLAQHPLRHRGGKGVISVRTSVRNGAVVACESVHGNEEIMLLSDQGKLVRTAVQGIPVVGRSTQGVRLIRLDEGECMVGMQRIAEDGEDGDGDDAPDAGA